ncbi:MAG: MFS transporter [Anaerolineae bacterium]
MKPQDNPAAATSRPAVTGAEAGPSSPQAPGATNLVHLSAAWFGQAYLWNGLHAMLLPLILVGLAPTALKATYLGALTFFGLVLAMLAQPIAGAISDRSGWLGRYGRRRPWMALGTAIDLGLLALLAIARDFLLVALLYAALQIASSFAEAALQGLMPDRVAPSQRGQASGYKNAAQIAGFVAGVGLGGFFASRGQIGLALAATGVALGASVAWTLLGVREQPAARVKGKGVSTASALRRSFRIDRHVAPGYTRLLGGRALLMAGYFALQGFAQYFIADKLGLPNPAGVTALLMAVMGAAIFLLAVPTGILADRMGRRPLNVFAALLGAGATAALLFVANVWQLVIVGGLVGASAGIFMSVNWAWAADLAPPQEAGRYLGLSNLATAGASALSRLVAGPIIDGGNALRAGIGYDLLFFVLALAMAAGALALASVPETRPISSRPVAEPVPSERQE